LFVFGRRAFTSATETSEAGLIAAAGGRSRGVLCRFGAGAPPAADVPAAAAKTEIAAADVIRRPMSSPPR
jgi:hypothetical protein